VVVGGFLPVAARQTKANTLRAAIPATSVAPRSISFQVPLADDFDLLFAADPAFLRCLAFFATNALSIDRFTLSLP